MFGLVPRGGGESSCSSSKRAPTAALDHLIGSLFNRPGIGRYLEVANGRMIVAVVVHGDEIQNPRPPVVVRLPFDHATFKDLPRRGELTDDEPRRRGDLFQLEEIFVVNDDQWKENPHLRDGRIVGPHCLQVRP